LELESLYTNPKKDVVRPPDHVISGYVAIVRGFILNDDYWSIDRLPNAYRKIGASDFRQEKLKKIRKQFHNWYKQSARLNLIGRQFTHKDVFELYTYGHVIHFDRAAELAKIRKHWMSYDVFMDRLCNVLHVLFKVLSAIYQCNEAVLSSYSKKPLPLP
jgi:hypothetical protein